MKTVSLFFFRYTEKNHYKYVQNVLNKGNNKITELRTILQRESQNSQSYKQTKSVNNRKTTCKHHMMGLSERHNPKKEN